MNTVRDHMIELIRDPEELGQDSDTPFPQYAKAVWGEPDPERIAEFYESRAWALSDNEDEEEPIEFEALTSQLFIFLQKLLHSARRDFQNCCNISNRHAGGGEGV